MKQLTSHGNGVPRHARKRREEFRGFELPWSNTTYTPNQFFDVCLPHCSRGAIRVVAYIIRRTLGWCDVGDPRRQFGKSITDARALRLHAAHHQQGEVSSYHRFKQDRR